MSAARPARGALAAPRRGAFAEGVLGEAIAAAQPAPPAAPVDEPDRALPEPVDEPDDPGDDGAAVAARPSAPARKRRRGRARAPMPTRLADEPPVVPLQVKVPRQAHWDLKVATTLQDSNMTRVVTALLSVYTEDPELGEALIALAEDREVSLGELLHATLADAEVELRD